MSDLQKNKKYMFNIVGAIHEVHKELGAGLNEYCYQEGLQMELTEQGIPFKRELSFHPTYHGKAMEATYRIEFPCKGDIIVECKAVSELSANNRAQLFNYMRLQKKPYGILANFSPKYAVIERYIYDAESNNILGVDGRIIQNNI